MGETTIDRAGDRKDTGEDAPLACKGEGSAPPTIRTPSIYKSDSCWAWEPPGYACCELSVAGYIFEFVFIARGYVVISATGLVSASIRVVSDNEPGFALDVVVGADPGEIPALPDEGVRAAEASVSCAWASTS